MIVYLKCSTNNYSRTVLEEFTKAVEKFHLPSRVCSDQGTENVQVAQYMLENRGVNRGSIITGPSVHNQRIDGGMFLVVSSKFFIDCSIT